MLRLDKKSGDFLRLTEKCSSFDESYVSVEIAIVSTEFIQASFWLEPAYLDHELSRKLNKIVKKTLELYNKRHGQKSRWPNSSSKLTDRFFKN